MLNESPFYIQINSSPNRSDAHDQAGEQHHEPTTTVSHFSFISGRPIVRATWSPDFILTW